jgi:DNA recombination protein RmuC
MEALVIVVLGIVSLVLAIVVVFLLRRPANTQVNPTATSDDLTARFSQVSLDVLGKAQASLLELADTRFRTLSQGSAAELEQKTLIDQQLGEMKAELGKVSTLVNELEKDRVQKFGELTNQLKNVGEQTLALNTTTGALREALASTSVRGQWGERMAEDVLRVAGFVEGVNYVKQKAVDGGGARPDFTFLLPRELKLNMDVKFPLDNYMRYLETDSEAERAQHQSAFLRDVRARAREVTGREYINPEQGTVDCVLLFIPNESVHSFIHEHDPQLLEMALRGKVVCCSPLTLFAVLAVVRQATDNFALQRASEEIIGLFGRFHAEWAKFTESLSVLGRRINSAQNAFQDVTGPRRRMLERPLIRIEALRQRGGIPVADVAADGLLELPSGGEEAAEGTALLAAQGDEREEV